MTWLLAIPGLLKRIPWQAYLAVAVLVAALFWHRSEVRQAVAAERGRWEAKIAADQKAQREREVTATATLHHDEIAAQAAATERKTEIDNATRNIPDQAPTARQHSRACIELRRQAKANRGDQPAC